MKKSNHTHPYNHKTEYLETRPQQKHQSPLLQRNDELKDRLPVTLTVTRQTQTEVVVQCYPHVEACDRLTPAHCTSDPGDI